MAPHAMGSVMGFLRRHKFISGFVAIALLYWIAPYATTAFDDPADKQQNKCSKDGPLLTERPGYFGKVLKIRLTNDGKFVDRCELTDVLYELNWDMPLHPNEFRPNPKPDAKPLPKFVVLYLRVRPAALAFVGFNGRRLGHEDSLSRRPMAELRPLGNGDDHAWQPCKI
jgi:hypothetical protein